MASIVAKNTSGVLLSRDGVLTNPLFGQHGYVGDVQGVDLLIDTAGKYRSGNYRIAGISHVQMSLDNVTYGAEGAALNVPGPITDSATRIYLKVGSTVVSAPALVLTQLGIIDASASGGTVVASAVSTSGAVTANVKGAAGTCVAASVASCAATVNSAALPDVTNFAASVSGTTVSLTWDASAGADHYLIEWGTDGVTYGTAIADQAGLSYSHTGRSANTTYYYRIKAHNAGHTVTSSNYATCYAGVQILITVAHAVELRCFNASWATARSGGGTLSAQAGDAATELGVNCQQGGGYYVDRAYLDFDTTTVIPAGCTIDQAWLRLTHTYVSWSSTGSAICKGTWSTSGGAAAADFVNVTLTDLGGPTSNPTVNTPTDYAITSPDSNVAKNGTARLVVVDRQKDYANVAPAAVSGNNLGGKAHATTDYRPQLKVSFHG